MHTAQCCNTSSKAHTFGCRTTLPPPLGSYVKSHVINCFLRHYAAHYSLPHRTWFGSTMAKDAPWSKPRALHHTQPREGGREQRKRNATQNNILSVHIYCVPHPCYMTLTNGEDAQERQSGHMAAAPRKKKNTEKHFRCEKKKARQTNWGWCGVQTPRNEVVRVFFFCFATPSGCLWEPNEWTSGWKRFICVAHDRQTQRWSAQRYI